MEEDWGKIFQNKRGFWKGHRVKEINRGFQRNKIGGLLMGHMEKC